MVLETTWDIDPKKDDLHMLGVKVWFISRTINSDGTYTVMWGLQLFDHITEYVTLYLLFALYL